MPTSRPFSSRLSREPVLVLEPSEDVNGRESGFESILESGDLKKEERVVVVVQKGIESLGFTELERTDRQTLLDRIAIEFAILVLV